MVALQVVFLFSLLFLQIVYHKYVLHFELEIKLYIHTIEKILKETREENIQWPINILKEAEHH